MPSPSFTTACPVTGLPVHRHSRWCLPAGAEGHFRLPISVIGDRILWLRPGGYMRAEDARRVTTLLGNVLRTAVPAGPPFIVIDDHAELAGISLDARRHLYRTLREERRFSTIIIYGASRTFGTTIRLARRLSIFPFDLVVAGDYAEAVMAAVDQCARLAEEKGGRRPAGDVQDGGAAAGAQDALGPRAMTLADYADELLAFMAGIHLEPYGFTPTFQPVPLNHPFRPVYDALSVLRDDMQAILQRHREARENLLGREEDLTAKQAVLHETHTTLKVLLAARQENRRRMGRLFRERLHVLLQPLEDTLEAGARTTGEMERVRLLKLAVGHIGDSLAGEWGPKPVGYTARERLIAFLLTTGMTVPAVAHLLKLSRRTVENHCRRMRRKAGLRGRRPRLGEWLRGRPADRIELGAGEMP